MTHGGGVGVEEWGGGGVSLFPWDHLAPGITITTTVPVIDDGVLTLYLAAR